MAETKKSSMPLLEAMKKQYPKGYPPPAETPAGDSGTTIGDLKKKGGRWKVGTAGAIDTTSRPPKTKPRRFPT